MAVQRVTIRRGDTFSAEAVYTDDSGSPVNLTSYTIRGQLTGRGRTYDMQAVVTNAAQGQFTIGAPATSTRNWEVGSYEADIQYSVGEEVSSTDSFFIDVVRDVTNAN